MMERGEPTLVPEWYKGSTGSASANGNSNHHSRSSLRSDEHGVRRSSRNGLSVSVCDFDSPHSLAFPDRRLPSFRRSESSNGSVTHGRVSPSSLQPYSGFGSSHHNKDREKDHELNEKKRSLLVENGFSNYTDLVIGSGNERDTLRHTPSFLGRHGEASSKRPSSDLSNGIITGASAMCSIGKYSFEREFPSLGVEERKPDISRVSSPRLSTAMDNLSRISSAAIGVDGWTSALAEVPVGVVGNGPTSSSSMQATFSSATSTSLSSSTGLNMAETLAQAPSHAHAASQVSVDTQKIEKLTRLQYNKLIPMKPSMPKSLALNSLEKSKAKGTKNGEYNVSPKVGLQSSCQLASHSPCTPGRSNNVKTSQVGNLHALNWEKNGITPIVRDGLTLQNASKPHVGVPIIVSPPPKSPINPNEKLDNKGSVSFSTLSSSGEKRLNSQAQNRNDFFNIIRQKVPLNRSLDSQEKERHASCTGLEYSMESDNGVTGVNNVTSEEPDRSILNLEDGTLSSDSVVARSIPDNREESMSFNPVVLKCVGDSDRTLSSGSAVVSRTSLTISGVVGSSPDSVQAESIRENVDEMSSDPVAAPSEEEVAFLRRLGWEENADGDALTPEEIALFYRKHPDQKASSRPGHCTNH